jgi:exodeoxyribonuclease-3
MRIATWNVNGLRARLDFLLCWLDARKPDLLALQELKLQDDQFPHDAFSSRGYRALTLGQKSWNGVAILSREEARPLERGLPGQEALGARWLAADVAGLVFASVYCPNGKHVGHEDFPRKLAFFDALAQHLADHHRPDRPLVVCGDFNVCPAPIDSWNEEALAGQIFHTAEERERLGRLRAWGLRDLFRELHPDARVFSWWDYRGGAFHRGHGLRIDFLLGTAPVCARTTAIEIDRDYRKKQDGLTPSDHAPVIAELSPEDR